MIHLPEHWLGSPAGLMRLIQASLAYHEAPLNFPPKPKLSADDAGEEPLSSLITVQDGVGVLMISGPMTSQASWLDDYFGIPSYPALDRAARQLAELHEAGEIHSVVQAYATPGGDADGISGIAESFQALAAQVPNTISHIHSKALSAGAWLASINSTVRIDTMAEAGSIGVISVARTLHRMFEEMGVDHEVIRSGKYKALLSPYEPISEQAVSDIQKKGSQLHHFFIEHMEQHRPALRQVDRSQWAEGQTFFGEEAIRVGFAGGPPISLNQLVNGLIEEHHAQSTTYGGGFMAKKTVLMTPEDQAKLASGVPIEDVQHQVVEEPEPVEPAPSDPADADVQVSAEPELVSYLREEVAGLRTELAAAQAERTKLAEQAQAEQVLGPIVIEAIHRLQVGLRQSPTVLTGLPASTLALQYQETKRQFEAQFPVGRRALSEDDETRQPVDLGEQRLALVK